MGNVKIVIAARDLSIVEINIPVNETSGSPCISELCDAQDAANHFAAAITNAYLEWIKGNA